MTFSKLPAIYASYGMAWHTLRDWEKEEVQDYDGHMVIELSAEDEERMEREYNERKERDDNRK